MASFVKLHSIHLEKKFRFQIAILHVMADRLTQLQVCLDQLVAQFNATINYVNTNAEPGLLDENENSVLNLAALAPVPGAQVQAPTSNQSPAQVEEPSSNKPSAANSVSNHPTARAQAEANFDNSLNELSTDIILKSRQLSMLIDSLPGIGVLPDHQLKIIEELAQELQSVEEQRTRKIEEKDKLLASVELVIMDVLRGISDSQS